MLSHLSNHSKLGTPASRNKGYKFPAAACDLWHKMALTDTKDDPSISKSNHSALCVFWLRGTTPGLSPCSPRSPFCLPAPLWLLFLLPAWILWVKAVDQTDNPGCKPPPRKGAPQSPCSQEGSSPSHSGWKSPPSLCPLNHVKTMPFPTSLSLFLAARVPLPYFTAGSQGITAPPRTKNWAKPTRCSHIPERIPALVEFPHQFPARAELSLVFASSPTDVCCLTIPCTKILR